jgi:hypothetical protein
MLLNFLFDYGLDGIVQNETDQQPGRPHPRLG